MSLTLKYDFVNDVSLEAAVGPTLALTRATTASVTDYFNVLKTVNSGEERYTGGRRVENITLQSETMSVGSWTAVNLAISDAADSIEGVNLSQLTDDSTDAEHSMALVNTLPTGPNTRTVSFYCKAGTATAVIVGWQNSHQATNVFNLSTGVWDSLHADSAAGSGVEDLGNGYYRAWCSTAVAARNDLIIGIYDGANSYVGTGKTVLVGGIQVEGVDGQDDPAPSEYQATTTAAVSKWYATKRRTNLALYSEDFSNAAWVASDVTKAAGRLTATDANGTALQAYTAIADDYTFSVKITRVTGTGNVDLTVDGGATWTTVAVTGAETRFSRTETGVSPGATTFGIRLVADTDVIDVSEAQLERGALTDYIATTTTTVESSAFDTAITPTGLKIEEARTNLCLQSETFLDGVSWLEDDNAASVADQAIAPDGTLTADKLLDDSSTGTGTPSFRQVVTAATTTSYVYSLYAKADQLDWVRIAVTGFAGISNPIQYYDLINGIVGTPAGAVDDSDIEDVGNGWYRCWLSFTTAADATGLVYINVADADGDVNVDLDGTSSIFVWGAQLEAGAFPTSYIPTVAASVTRNSDDITSADMSWYTGMGCSVYTEFSIISAIEVRSGRVFSVSDGSTDNRLFIVKPNTSDRDIDAAVEYDNNTPVTFDSDDTVVDGVILRAVLGIAAADGAFYIDGAQEETSSSAGLALPISPTVLGIGRSDSAASNYLNGHIAEIRYYNTRLTNQQLEDMSNGTFPTFIEQELEVGDADWYRRRRILGRKRRMEGRRYLSR